jgi:hypothetical protein
VRASVESFPSVASFVAYERKLFHSYKHTGAWGAGEPAQAEMIRRSGSSIRTHSLTSTSRQCSAADEGLRAGGDVGGWGGAERSEADLSEGRERESDMDGEARLVGAVNRGRRNMVLCVRMEGVIR